MQEKMNIKMIRLVNGIFKLFKKYIREFEDTNGSCDGVVNIKHTATGEIVVFAESVERLKRYVRFMRIKDNND